MNQSTIKENALKSKILNWVIWGICVVAVAIALLGPFTGNQTALVTMFITLPFALIHGYRRYGVKKLLVFFVIAWVLSNFFENLSIMTSFPFGNYYYTGSGKIFLVPLGIGLVYVGLGYLCWTVASALLDEADAHLDWRKGWSNRLNTFLLPIIAGAIMTMWDVSTDHLASTVNHTWIWENGGGLFGVPFTNYWGWWFVTWSFFQVFSLYLAWKQSTSSDSESVVQHRGGLLPNVLIYGSLGLSYIPYYFFADKSGIVTDAAGQSWSMSSLIESALILSTFTMVPVALMALGKLWKGDIYGK